MTGQHEVSFVAGGFFGRSGEAVWMALGSIQVPHTVLLLGEVRSHTCMESEYTNRTAVVASSSSSSRLGRGLAQPWGYTRRDKRQRVSDGDGFTRLRHG